jgi:hypothetical protein
MRRSSRLVTSVIHTYWFNAYTKLQLMPSTSLYVSLPSPEVDDSPAVSLESAEPRALVAQSPLRSSCSTEELSPICTRGQTPSLQVVRTTRRSSSGGLALDPSGRSSSHELHTDVSARRIRVHCSASQQQERTDSSQHSSRCRSPPPLSSRSFALTATR